MTYSQAGQDLWVAALYPGPGFFVDLGAYDGVESSNSLYLEQKLGWNGICVEANIDYFNNLTINRPNATNINIAISSYPGEVNFCDQLITDNKSAPMVKCDTIQAILQNVNCPSVIDYMSIDIEGMEYDALSAFDFDSFVVGLMTVEHNLYCEGPFNKDRIFALLSSHGFVRVVEDAPVLGVGAPYSGKPFEDWYVHETYFPKLSDFTR